jgi:predicted acylesterase/phospholipase RssA
MAANVAWWRCLRPGGASKPDTLVVSGGGLKGVAALGAVHALRRRGMLDSVTTMVGTSAGALVCAALACGKDPLDVLRRIGPKTFRPDIDIARLPFSYGLDSGAGLVRFIDEVLEERHTFESLRRVRGVRLVVCVTNLNRREPEYLGPDTHPHMDVALALRMSCSVPLYFTAVRVAGEDVYVDGVLTDNFPCEWALANGARGVLGIRFASSQGPIRSLDAYLMALADCAVRHGPRRSTRGVRVLELHPGIPTSVNFNAPRAEVRRLFASGVQQARTWVKKTE